MIILTSDFSTVAKHMVDEFFTRLDYTVLFIDTASENEEADPEWLKAALDSFNRVDFVVTRFTVTDKSIAEIEIAIDNHDIIYMSGGNTYYLLQQLQKSGSLDLIRGKVNEGKTYIGMSAGSIVAAPDICSAERIDHVQQAPEITGTKGLNIVDFVTMPHWGSEDARDVYLEDRMFKMYKDDSIPFMLLSDHQYVVCTWNRFMTQHSYIVNSRKYNKNP